MAKVHTKQTVEVPPTNKNDSDDETIFDEKDETDERAPKPKETVKELDDVTFPFDDRIGLETHTGRQGQMNTDSHEFKMNLKMPDIVFPGDKQSKISSLPDNNNLQYDAKLAEILGTPKSKKEKGDEYPVYPPPPYDEVSDRTPKSKKEKGDEYPVHVYPPPYDEVSDRITDYRIIGLYNERDRGRDPMMERLENIEQEVTEIRQTTSRLVAMSVRSQDEMTATRRQLQGLADTVSRNVVARLANNQSRVQLEEQSETPSRPGDQISRESLFPRCMCNHCKNKCTCKCHQNEKRKEDKDIGRAKQASFRPLCQTDSESDVNCTYNILDTDMSDDGLPLDTNAEDREDGACSSPLPEEEHSTSVTQHSQIHGASGGDPGHPSDEDPSSNDESDSEPHKKKRDKNIKEKKKNWVIDQDAWKICIENKEDFEKIARRLLLEEKLPSQTLLDEACLRYKRTNEHIQDICKHICNYIKDKSKSFLDVWAAYQFKKGDTSFGNKVVFVILTDSTHDIEGVEDFNTYKRNINEITSKIENETINMKEKEDPPSPREIEDLETCLKRNAKLEMGRHSNLTRITASWYRSSGYGTSNVLQERKLCIAMYVHVKGYIPLDEEPFKAEIERYPVDVREGLFILCGNPDDYHQNVKMGCAIRGGTQGGNSLVGTLGPFLWFKDDAYLYAITCGHVFFQSIHPKQFNCDINVPAFQPPGRQDSFGIVERVVYKEGSSGDPGMEIAVIKINLERYPDSGTFPDRGFGSNEPFEFFNGKCCRPEHLIFHRPVYKYGCTTKQTMGKCRVKNASVRTRKIWDNDYQICLHDQVEIESVNNTPFAELGDSGAIVLTDHGNTYIAVGIFEGKHEDVYLMTPISAILEELERQKNKRCKLKTFETHYQPVVDPRFDEHGIEQILKAHQNDIRNDFERLNNQVQQSLQDQTNAIRSLLQSFQTNNTQ